MAQSQLYQPLIKVAAMSPENVLTPPDTPQECEATVPEVHKLVVSTSGLALSREMAQMKYDVDYYIHVDTADDAVKLVQHMPYSGHALTTDDINKYAGPVVEQAINQLIQVTPLEQVNEKIHDLSELVYNHLQEFLAIYGVTLNTVKVLVHPSDERMKALISLKAFGLSEMDAVRYYTAMIMAEHGAVSAPNMAVGQPFNIGSATPVVSADKYVETPKVAAPRPTLTTEPPTGVR